MHNLNDLLEDPACDFPYPKEHAPIILNNLHLF